MKNKKIKLKAAGSGVKLWKVAAELGMSDSSFSRKLRQEFSEEERKKVFGIIDNLIKEGNLNENEND